jgi:hypothetical protein
VTYTVGIKIPDLVESFLNTRQVETNLRRENSAVFIQKFIKKMGDDAKPPVGPRHFESFLNQFI